MSFSSDLQKLPPPALDVIRFLATQPELGAGAEVIMAGAGLSQRGFGKAIRRLVTRYYVEMRDQGYYALTPSGEQAARELGVEPQGAPDASSPVAPPPAPAPESIPAAATVRRLSAIIQAEWVAGSPSLVRLGFDPAPEASEDRLWRVILRLTAPDCTVVPDEHPLEVRAGAVGPVRFRVTPQREGSVRVRVQVLHVTASLAIRPLGGFYFDRHVAGFPTPDSAEVETLAADILFVPEDGA